MDGRLSTGRNSLSGRGVGVPRIQGFERQNSLNVLGPQPLCRRRRDCQNFPGNLPAHAGHALGLPKARVPYLSTVLLCQPKRGNSLRFLLILSLALVLSPSKDGSLPGSMLLKIGPHQLVAHGPRQPCPPHPYPAFGQERHHDPDRRDIGQRRLADKLGRNPVQRRGWPGLDKLHGRLHQRRRDRPAETPLHVTMQTGNTARISRTPLLEPRVQRRPAVTDAGGQGGLPFENAGRLITNMDDMSTVWVYGFYAICL
jgi:hypothetical protein